MNLGLITPQPDCSQPGTWQQTPHSHKSPNRLPVSFLSTASVLFLSCCHKGPEATSNTKSSLLTTISSEEKYLREVLRLTVTFRASFRGSQCRGKDSEKQGASHQAAIKLNTVTECSQAEQMTKTGRTKN